MKQVPPDAKKKSNARKAAIIRSLRGKYKHLDLMTALMDSRNANRSGGSNTALSRWASERSEFR